MNRRVVVYAITEEELRLIETTWPFTFGLVLLVVVALAFAGGLAAVFASVGPIIVMSPVVCVVLAGVFFAGKSESDLVARLRRESSDPSVREQQ